MSINSCSVRFSSNPSGIRDTVDGSMETISLRGMRGVVARIGSGAAWPFGGLAYSLTIARDSGLPNSAIRFNTLHPIIASLFCDS